MSQQIPYLEMYENMLLIRLSEERVAEYYKVGKIVTALATVGQEAVASGAVANLRKDDFVTMSHRASAVSIAKGGIDQLKVMWAEYFGKETGCNKGRGGHMHVGDFDKGILYGSGIVGGALPHAVGFGLSFSLKGTDQVCIAFFGEGASNQGTFHESLNLAAIWRLPVVFVCENNQYAEATHVSKMMLIENVADRAASYGMPGATVDGNDVLEVYAAVGKAVKRAREKGGPSLIECKTFMTCPHWYGDPQTYLSPGEMDSWKAKDPIKRFRQYLLEHKIVTEEKLRGIEQECSRKIEQALKFADESPPANPEQMMKDVFVREV